MNGEEKIGLFNIINKEIVACNVKIDKYKQIIDLLKTWRDNHDLCSKHEVSDDIHVSIETDTATRGTLLDVIGQIHLSEYLVIDNKEDVDALIDFLEDRLDTYNAELKDAYHRMANLIQ